VRALVVVNPYNVHDMVKTVINNSHKLNPNKLVYKDVSIMLNNKHRINIDNLDIIPYLKDLKMPVILTGSRFDTKWTEN